MHYKFILISLRVVKLYNIAVRVICGAKSEKDKRGSLISDTILLLILLPWTKVLAS